MSSSLTLSRPLSPLKSPIMDDDIHSHCSDCSICQELAGNISPSILSPKLPKISSAMSKPHSLLATLSPMFGRKVKVKPTSSNGRDKSDNSESSKCVKSPKVMRPSKICSTETSPYSSPKTGKKTSPKCEKIKKSSPKSEQIKKISPSNPGITSPMSGKKSTSPILNGLLGGKSAVEHHQIKVEEKGRKISNESSGKSTDSGDRKDKKSKWKLKISTKSSENGSESSSHSSLESASSRNSSKRKKTDTRKSHSRGSSFDYRLIKDIFKIALPRSLSAGDLRKKVNDDIIHEDEVDGVEIRHVPEKKSSSLKSKASRLKNSFESKERPKMGKKVAPVMNRGVKSKELDQPVSVDIPLKGTGIVGLKNLGNTCFMNSILQCLSHSPKVREYFLSKKYKTDLSTTSKMQGRLAEEFANLLCDMWSGRNDTVSPTKFKSTVAKSAPRFVGYSQQDSQEFLRFFLEGLHEDLNKGRKGKRKMEEPPKGLSDRQLAEHRWNEYVAYDNSAIVDIFVGLLKSTLTCTVCDHQSVTFDPFWDLSLPLPRGRMAGRDLTLKSCFEDFSQEEDLDGDEKPQCENCKKRQRCTKKFTLERYPSILVLHLKRFSEVRYRTKLSTRVDFPVENLDLSKFSSNPKDCSAPMYNLIGVSNHSGNTFSGHYTAYCKTGSRWNRFSDTSVSSVSSSDLATSEAYVLFYERKK